MDAKPTVLVLGRRTTDNMPSLTRMLEILRPGMDATVPTSSVRITGRTSPVMDGKDDCPMTGEDRCPTDLDEVYKCPCMAGARRKSKD